MLPSNLRMTSISFRKYLLDHIVDMRESRNFEFKTGGGAYPIEILPEVRQYSGVDRKPCMRASFPIVQALSHVLSHID